MEKISYHKSHEVLETVNTVVSTIVFVALMALGIAFFVRLLLL